MIIALLLACTNESTSEPIAGPNRCLAERTAVEAEDDSLGFSATEVTATLQASGPTTMSWDYTIFDIGAYMSVEVGGLDGAPTLVSVPDDESCAGLPRLLLAVPVQFTVALADGGLVALFTEEVFAEANEASGIHLVDAATGQDWPMTVSAELEAQISAWVVSEHGTTSPAEVVLWFGGNGRTWAAGGLGVELMVDESGVRAWDGSWAL